MLLVVTAMKRLLAALLVLAPSLAFAGGFSGDGFGSSGFYQLYTIPTPIVSTGLITPVMSIFNPSTSGSQTLWGALAGAGPVGTTSNSATARRIPIPVAGTISALAAGFSTTQPAGTAIRINLNGANGNTDCVYATTSPFNCSYSGTGDHVVAGTLAQWKISLGSGSWNTSGGPAQASFLFQADSGQNGPIFSAADSTAVASSTIFEGIGTPSPSATEAIASVVQPAGGQLAGIYCYPNGSDNGANVHSCTVMQNGVATALACTDDPANPTLGCCANVGGTGNIGGNPLAPCSSISAITVAVGDTLSNQVSCGGTCATINPGMSVIWQPTTSGQVPLYASTASSPSTSVPWFLSVVDAAFSQTVATNWNISPNLTGTMTFSNLIACTFSTTALGSWQETFQYTLGTNLAPPSTNSPVVATFGNGNLCPYSGVPARLLNGGFQDTTHSQVVSAGYTLGLNIVPSVGTAPTAASRWKTSVVVTVP